MTSRSLSGPPALAACPQAPGSPSAGAYGPPGVCRRGGRLSIFYVNREKESERRGVKIPHAHSESKKDKRSGLL